MKLAAVFTLAALLAAPPAFGGRPSPVAPLPGRHAHPAAARQVDFFQAIDANNLEMVLSNVGSFAYEATSSSAGLRYPKGTTSSVVFAGGLWLGALVGGAPRVTVADYAFEYRPGSAVGAMPELPSHPQLRVYKLFRVYADPLARDLALADYNEGAVSRGAPFVNVLPDGSLSIRGDQMSWAVCNDLDATAHDSPSGATNPLQVEVAQTTWAYDRPGPFGNSIFVEFKIINRGPILLTDMHLSLWLDPDLGGFTDDLVGCDSTRSLGYCYNANNADSEYDNTPPAVGVDLLQGPFSAALGHRLPMAAFIGYTNGTDPTNADESFHSMHGRDRFGNTLFDPASQATKFMYAGDPVGGTGWRDPAGNDKRFLLSSGPFTMPGGTLQTVVLAIVVAQGSDRLDSVARLRVDDDLVQTAFDTGTLGMLDAPGPASVRLSLDRVYPNPARERLGLAFVLPEAGEATVELLDLAGRRMLQRSLGTLSAGPHAVTMDAATGALAPGVYFLKLSHAKQTATRRVALSR